MDEYKSLDKLINKAEVIRDYNNNVINIYHGSDHEIKVPQYGLGKKANDFGVCFYLIWYNHSVE